LPSLWRRCWCTSEESGSTMSESYIAEYMPMDDQVQFVVPLHWYSPTRDRRGGGRGPEWKEPLEEQISIYVGLLGPSRRRPGERPMRAGNPSCVCGYCC